MLPGRCVCTGRCFTGACILAIRLDRIVFSMILDCGNATWKMRVPRMVPCRCLYKARMCMSAPRKGCFQQVFMIVRMPPGRWKVSCRRLYRAAMYMLATRLNRVMASLGKTTWCWLWNGTWKMRVPRKVSCRRLYRAGMYMLATRLERAVLTNWAMKSLSVRLLFSALTVWCLCIMQTGPGLIGQLFDNSRWTIVAGQ